MSARARSPAATRDKLGLGLLKMIPVDADDRDMDALLQETPPQSRRPIPRDPPVTIATLPSRDADISRNILFLAGQP